MTNVEAPTRNWAKGVQCYQLAVHVHSDKTYHDVTTFDMEFSTHYPAQYFCLGIAREFVVSQWCSPIPAHSPCWRSMYLPRCDLKINITAKLLSHLQVPIVDCTEGLSSVQTPSLTAITDLCSFSRKVHYHCFHRIA